MIILPFGFTATKYPGYFWDTTGHELYSLKIAGELRKMPMTPFPNRWNYYQKEDGWRVSHKGRKQWLWKSDLEKLVVTDSVLPCQRWGC